MGSIRPLITITIILVAGAYLFVKINEGPVAPIPGATTAWQSEVDVPPLASTVDAPSTAGGMAPSWPTTPSAAPLADSSTSALNSAQSAPAIADVATATESLPAVPAIPALPEMAATTAATPTAAATLPASVPTTLPANIPTAIYPDAPATSGAATPADPLSSQTSAITPPPITSGAPASQSVSTLDAPLSDNPLRQSAPPATAADPYAPTMPTPTQAATPPTAPGAASFAASWPEIQAALDRGELADAHKLLTRWYGDPSLTPAEAEYVETLLSQLAGTVVYSTEHQLQPAHVVRPGETLDIIANEHHVPWQLLAKINGIAAVDQLTPGQQIKVVPGPFSAVVDLRRSQLTLMVDGRYAGKFPVTVPTGATVTEGEWLVDQKLAAPSTSAATPGTPAAADTVDRTIVLRGQSEAGPAAIGPTMTIASGHSPTATATAPAAIQVSPADAEELSDILSIGSRVVIRR